MPEKNTVLGREYYKIKARDLDGVWLLSIYLTLQYGNNNLRRKA
jgi:hypothetical protein